MAGEKKKAHSMHHCYEESHCDDVMKETGRMTRARFDHGKNLISQTDTVLHSSSTFQGQDDVKSVSVCTRYACPCLYSVKAVTVEDTEAHAISSCSFL